MTGPYPYKESTERIEMPDAEKKLLDKIVELHNEFMSLDRGHPMEVNEWVTGIHQLQSIVEHRILRNLFPNYFR